jgi:glutathione S-transferase
MNHSFSFVATPYGPMLYNIPLQSSYISSDISSFCHDWLFKSNHSRYERAHERKRDATSSGRIRLKLYDLETHEQSDIIRLLLTFANIPHKDERLTYEQWITMKEHRPFLFDQLPVLRVAKTTKIAHCDAILRYLAREFDFYGKNNRDHAIIDTLIEIHRSYRETISLIDDGQHMIRLDHLRLALERMEHVFDSYRCHGPFFFDSYVSLADLIVCHTTNDLTHAERTLLNNYPHLKRIRSRLEKYPSLVNFYQQRYRRRLILAYRLRSRGMMSPVKYPSTTKSFGIPLKIDEQQTTNDTNEHRPALSIVVEESIESS